MRFAAVQFDIVWEDKRANHAIIERMIDEADPPIVPGAFVLLPELGDTGFSFNLHRIVDDQSLNWARTFARSRRIWLQPGFAERPPPPVGGGSGGGSGGAPSGGGSGGGRNCAAIIDPEGSVRGIYRKVHPFTYSKEIEFFEGGDSLLVQLCGEFKIAPMICYDLRFPELWRLAVVDDSRPAEVFTIGASWPAVRQQHWRALLIARAIENQAYIVAVNRVGRDPHLEYAGGSIIISPTGEVLAEAGHDATVLQADLNPDHLREWREKFPALADIHRELLGTIREAPDE